MTELISRQAALAEIDKNREALLQSGMTGAEHILVHYGRRVIEELPTIDVPDKNVGELISRQAALEMLNDNELERQADDVFDGDLHRYKRAAQRIIAQLPSAEKHGKWITEYDSWGGLFKTVRAHKCSICGHYLDFDGVNAGRGDANYCPNCGAKMEKSEE